MKILTKQQRAILDFIEGYIKAERISPTHQEIMDHFHFSSPGSVYKHLQALKKKGVLLSEKHVIRSLTLPQDNTLQKATVELPYIGLIRAGFPIETFPNVNTIPIPAAYVPHPEKSYLLKVKGDTLREEQISEGDLLIVEARSSVSAGEMTLILVNAHDTLLKKYYPDHPYVRLEGLNASVRPMILREENLEIQGVLIGLFRTFV